MIENEKNFFFEWGTPNNKLNSVDVGLNDTTWNRHASLFGN